MSLFKQSKKAIQFAVAILGISLLSSANAFSSSWPLRAEGQVRYLKFIKVYDVKLYSPVALSPKTILKPDVSKCLKLDYAVDLDVTKLRLATEKILRRQHPATYLNKIRQPLEQLQGAYKNVKKGDSYQLCYDGQSRKMRLELNNNRLVEIQSADLAKAYLGIWLSGNKPISGPLYNRLFSQKINI